jgi:hypothetical protein
MAGRLGINELI